MNLVKTVRNAVDTDNVILGTKETLSAVLNGKVKFVVVASNCDAESRDDLKKYTELSGVELHEFDGTSIDLGEVCGKPFVVSMLGIVENKEPAGKRK